MPLLQVRDCPEDIYRKISLVAKTQNRTLAQQIIVLPEKVWDSTNRTLKAGISYLTGSTTVKLQLL